MTPFKIGDRIVDPSLNRVTHGDRTVQVEPKIMHVLVTLAERAGEVVTRDELMTRVWNGVFVTDDALHRAVRELRRLFDDDSEQPRVIETIRKRGYRLIAPVDRREGLKGLDGGPDESRVAHPAHPARVMAIGGAALVIVALVVVAAVTRRSEVSTEAHVRFMPLTSEPGNEVDPAMSASGRLAYVARAGDGRAHIFTKGSSDASPNQVTRGETREYAPVWSPDETRLAFVRMDADGGNCAIWIAAAADGRDARSLTPCTSADEFRMSWSPDGQLIAVTAGANTVRSPSHIEIVDVTSGLRRALTTPPPAHSGDWSPAFSPDGREVAFVRAVSGSITDVYVVPVEPIAGEGNSDPPRRVTNDNADVLGVDWEPDGRHLVFSSDRAGGIGLWRIPASGGQPAMLAGGGAKLKHPSIARRTGAVAYEDWQYEINLREQSASDPARADSISPTSDRWNFHPQISPDGSRLVFQSTRSGQYELWLSDRDNGNWAGARPLTRSAIYKSPARWSPDNRHLTFTTRVDGRSDVWILDVENGETKTLVSDPTSAVAPSWSHDGRRVYFGSLRSGDWQIWSVEAENGRVQQVTTNGGYAAMESADGTSLFISRLDRLGLWQRPIAGGAETLAAERVAAEQWPNWGLFDRGIYFVSWPDDGDPQLNVVESPFADRPIADHPIARSPIPLARLPEFAWSGIALSRDGSRVIYAHADRRSANIGGLTVTR